MNRLLLCTATFGLFALAAAAPQDKDITWLDLQPKANHKLADIFHGGGLEGNHLDELPRGQQKLGGVSFKVGDKLIQLSSTIYAEVPDKVEGIKVGQTLSKLHILHATGYGGAEEGNSIHVKDGTKIGAYTIHYADKTKETIPIVYGEDVRDWWNSDESKKTERGKVAWEGHNPATREYNRSLRLYLATWKNPHPAKTVTSIDYTSTNDSPAAPFCVAMTVEGE